MFASLIGVFAVIIGIAVAIFAGLYFMLGATSAMAAFFVFTCIVMTLVILIQKPKGGGLSGAFGGAGGGQQGVFGAKAGDVLTVITIGFFVLFLALGMGLVYSTRSDARAIDEPTDSSVRPNDAPVSPVVPPASDDAPAPASTPEPELESEVPATPAPAADTPAPAAPKADAPSPAPAEPAK